MSEEQIDKWLIKCGITKLDPNTDLERKIEILDGIIDEHAKHMGTIRTLFYIGFFTGTAVQSGRPPGDSLTAQP